MQPGLAPGIHLLVIDLQPPGRRDSHGMRGAIWEEIDGQGYALPSQESLTIVAYEFERCIRDYVFHTVVGDELPDAPLFLEPQKSATIPLEATYQTALAELPRRWRQVLESVSN